MRSRLGLDPIEADRHDQDRRQTACRGYWNWLVRQEQPTAAEHARHVADRERLFERVVVDEHVRGDDQIEPAVRRHRETFEHDIQFHAADIEDRLRPKVHRTRPHIAGRRRPGSPTVPVPMRSPKRRQYSTSAGSSREPALSARAAGSAVCLTPARTLPRLAQVRDDARADVERRDRRALRDPERRSESASANG